MTALSRPVRVAVIGGGCAALTTAFELTRPEHKGQYDVTVYQMGWRLGGKGASGRGIADRIEEHGLHLWMGFYENAFCLMRECYEERSRIFPNSRFASWKDAFKPAPDVGVAEHSPSGWSFWMAHFPPGHGEPGHPANGSPYTPAAYLRQCVILVFELVRSAAAAEAVDTRESENCRTWRPEEIAGTIDAVLRYGQLATIAAILEASQVLRGAIDLIFPGPESWLIPPICALLDALAAAARQQLERLVETDSELRRVWQVIDLILAVLAGSIRCGLATHPDGFDSINGEDWRAWLRKNGASEQSLDSGFVRGIYNLVFAFEDGDVNRPSLAAGVALRGAMRMFFTYRGSLFWRMSAGMGDVVFAPLYQVLKSRGVKFAFFHRLRNVGLSKAGEPGTPYVTDLEFDVQARVKYGREYEPLVDVNNVPSWPSQPLFAQLVSGDSLSGRDFESGWDRRRAGVKTLKVGQDFDAVVLGVSVASLPEVAAELIERNPRWREMVRRVKTVPTQTFQLWLRGSTPEIGWPHAPGNLAGFVEPFDTWAEMSHLIPEEHWEDQVRSIAYFCGVLPDATGEGGKVDRGIEGTQKEAVRANAVRFLETHASGLWPNAFIDGQFQWDIMACEGETNQFRGAKRFDGQYWRANISPADRYVQSLPGSIEYRISPLDYDFDNLTVAGDWTASGLDSGCIESAVMSGRLAARAISGKPETHEIVGYNHP